jgi:hypothetical protein
MSSFDLDQQGRVQVSDYTAIRPFASFLPGIAGLLGIPMWAFYVNRGQAIASFGIANKDNAIMEFQPANRAYQLTPFNGFRTFLKVERDRGPEVFYEPFSPWSDARSTDRTMVIAPNELALSESNPKLGLQVGILYFTLPGEPFAGLVRQVTLTNQGQSALAVEMLDGMPAVVPFGVSNAALKEIGRTIEAWMEVFQLEERTPFYRVRASTADTAEVAAVEAGHFALALAQPMVAAGSSRAGHQLLPVIVDPQIVFQENTSLSSPDGFRAVSLDHLLQRRQILVGKTPSAFFGLATELAPAQSISLYEIFGHASSVQVMRKQLDRLTPAFFEAKRRQANFLTEQLTETIGTHTTSPLFDAYSRQTFLDNVLRGGWPLLFGEGERSHVYHVYSRKHGDLERDYNDFFLAPEYYSQGNGNYRDVNQNRRNDVLFEPRVEDSNIRMFMSLIQADGYNPLVVQGTTFSLDQERWPEVLTRVDQPDLLEPVLSRPFTPGSLLKHVEDHGMNLRLPAEAFLGLALQNAQQQIEATFGEGYWIDHWTYNLDLIESYLAVYPENKQQLLFETSLPYFDSPACVRPRSERYVLSQGQPHQLHAVSEDEEKAGLLATRTVEPNWARTRYGRGRIFRSTLFEKLVLLTLLKFATLDPWGMGVEMEAGKPGWYDALNGLPGLFGSSLAETFELQRLLAFLQMAIEERGEDTIVLPVEAYDLLQAVADRLDLFFLTSGNNGSFAYWDDVATAREGYRARVRLGFDGATVPLTLGELAQTLTQFQIKVEAGVARALAETGGLPPTYFIFEVTDFELRVGVDGEPLQDEQGRPYIRSLGFQPQPLPPFLEGAVRAMKMMPHRKAALDLHRKVLSSDLYDQRLGMFKVNASLADQSQKIGRARAFTPGWLENESIWLHMAYKYLLELLKAGLYDEFFTAARTGLVPFLDPKVYGRSPLENSSFIVSSVHPDETLHGAGFVARLSGSTAEFLSIWQLMMAGPQPFFLRDGELCLTWRPALPGWLFDEVGDISFRFLGHTAVTYHNSGRLDTWQASIRAIHLHARNVPTIEIDGDTIGAPLAEEVRRGAYGRVDVYL